MKKEYTLSVPLTNLSFGGIINREKAVEILKKMEATRVFLAIGSNSETGEKRQKELDALKANSDYLHSRGFETGAWLWSLMSDRDDVVKMVSPSEKTDNNVACPADKRHRELMFSFVRDIAKTSVDIIMFDDDFRYGFHGMGFGCLCENHLEMIRNILGEKADRETIAENILNGGKNKYRDAFIKANGLVLEDFALECRKSLDTVFPSTRLGFCSCITSWDIDGTTPDRLSKLFAGKTRPFYRLIGAPYWAAMRTWGFNNISYVIEQERLEASRRQNTEIEIFSEGDTFPRPRHFVPSAFLEGFDTVLRADGCTDGILKYSFDYCAGCDYETGYNNNHIKNMPAYAAADRMFGDKITCGVRVYDKMKKFAGVVMPDIPNDAVHSQNLAFNRAAVFLACSSIPSVYNGNEYGGIAFGEDADVLTDADLKKGVILDYPAAEALAKKGKDTGIESAGEIIRLGTEYFNTGEKTGHLKEIFVKELKLKKDAEILSETENGNKKSPVSYFYENGDGCRFLVYAFDGYHTDDEMFRNYERQKQLINAIPRLCGKALPVYCAGNPDLYILSKKNGNRICAGLWNFFPDEIAAPEVVFEKEIVSAEYFGTDGTVCGNKITLSRLEPYGFAFIEAEFKE